ncbi:thioredoxin family protein [Zhouia sp. PK063]|uniref:thioredoxin family protein n=1 Tax=Zhouia sp. PK063 TaxID=3373602 RepID=UPI0037B9505E
MKNKTLYKLSIITLLLLCFTSVKAQQSSNEVLKEAISQAQQTNKNIMIIFHASWCSWCKRMDKQMNSENCKALFDKNYVIKHLTVYENTEHKKDENLGAEEMILKYNNNQKTGIPFWLIFDEKGNLLTDSKNNGQNMGCPTTKEEVAAFLDKLKNTSNLNDSQLAIIQKEFEELK